MAETDRPQSLTEDEYLDLLVASLGRAIVHCENADCGAPIRRPRKYCSRACMFAVRAARMKEKYAERDKMRAMRKVQIRMAIMNRRESAACVNF